MTRMSTEEKQTFLKGLHIGVLGLNDPGRGPLTTPLWYDYVPGGELWFLIGAESRKAKLLEVGTRISLAAQTETAPYVYVSIEAPVTAIEKADAPTLLKMAQRYLGVEMGQAYADGSDAQTQIIVRAQPERWLAVDYNKLNS